MPAHSVSALHYFRVLDNAQATLSKVIDHIVYHDCSASYINKFSFVPRSVINWNALLQQAVGIAVTPAPVSNHCRPLTDAVQVYRSVNREVALE